MSGSCCDSSPKSERSKAAAPQTSEAATEQPTAATQKSECCSEKPANKSEKTAAAVIARCDD